MQKLWSRTRLHLSHDGSQICDSHPGRTGSDSRMGSCYQVHKVLSCRPDYGFFFCLYFYKIERSIWNFGFGNPLIVRSLMSCCGNLGNNAENSAKDRGLACGLSEGNKDLVRATHMIERFWAPGASTTHSRLDPLRALSYQDSSS